MYPESTRALAVEVIGAVRRLDTEPRRRAREGPRHQGAEHARVHREPQGGGGQGLLKLTPGARIVERRYRSS